MLERLSADLLTTRRHQEYEEDEGCLAQQFGVSLSVYFYLGSIYEGTTAHSEDAAI